MAWIVCYDVVMNHSRLCPSRPISALVLLALMVGCSANKKPLQSKTSEPKVAETVPAKTVTPAPVSGDALRLAAYEGKTQTVRAAIDAGMDINAAAPGKLLTPLHMAAYNGHSEIVKLLIDNGAKIDCRDNEGKTPLIHACTGPFHQTVEILLNAGADVNARESTESFTPLMMGAGLGETEVVKVLLQHGADKEMRDEDGDTAIVHAQNKGHQDIIGLLSP